MALVGVVPSKARRARIGPAQLLLGPPIVRHLVLCPCWVKAQGSIVNPLVAEEFLTTVRRRTIACFFPQAGYKRKVRASLGSQPCVISLSCLRPTDAGMDAQLADSDEPWVCQYPSRRGPTCQSRSGTTVRCTEGRSLSKGRAASDDGDEAVIGP